MLFHHIDEQIDRALIYGKLAAPQPTRHTKTQINEHSRIAQRVSERTGTLRVRFKRPTYLRHHEVGDLLQCGPDNVFEERTVASSAGGMTLQHTVSGDDANAE